MKKIINIITLIILITLVISTLENRYTTRNFQVSGKGNLYGTINGSPAIIEKGDEDKIIRYNNTDCIKVIIQDDDGVWREYYINKTYIKY